MAGTSYHHGNLREELITEAMKILQEQDVDAVTLRNLSNSLGVSRAAPYRHFKNKTALLSAVATQGFRMLEQVCSHIPPGNPGERLMNLGRRYLSFAFNNPRLYSFMFDPERFTDPVQEELRTASDSAFSRLELILDEFPVKESADFNAGTVWAMVHGLAVILNQNLVRMIGKNDQKSETVSRGITERNSLLVDHALTVLAKGISSVTDTKIGEL